MACPCIGIHRGFKRGGSSPATQVTDRRRCTASRKDATACTDSAVEVGAGAFPNPRRTADLARRRGTPVAGKRAVINDRAVISTRQAYRDVRAASTATVATSFYAAAGENRRCSRSTCTASAGLYAAPAASGWGSDSPTHGKDRGDGRAPDATPACADGLSTTTADGRGNSITFIGGRNSTDGGKTVLPDRL